MAAAVASGMWYAYATGRAARVTAHGRVASAYAVAPPRAPFAQGDARAPAAGLGMGGITRATRGVIFVIIGNTRCVEDLKLATRNGGNFLGNSVIPRCPTGIKAPQCARNYNEHYDMWSGYHEFRNEIRPVRDLSDPGEILPPTWIDRNAIDHSRGSIDLFDGWQKKVDKHGTVTWTRGEEAADGSGEIEEWEWRRMEAADGELRWRRVLLGKPVRPADAPTTTLSTTSPSLAYQPYVRPPLTKRQFIDEIPYAPPSQAINVSYLYGDKLYHSLDSY